jgi:Spy/CpxP family protein refolding chaperone
MNKKIQTFLLGSAAVALSAVSLAISPLATSANAQASGEGAATPRPGMHRQFGTAAPLISIALSHQSELGLSATQVSNLENIRTDFQNRTAPILQDLRSIESKLREVQQQNPVDLVQAKALIEQSEKRQAELRYQRLEALENGKAILTAQQQDQLKNLVASMHQRFRKAQPGQAS